MDAAPTAKEASISERVRELCRTLEEGGIKYSDELIGFSKPVGRQK